MLLLEMLFLGEGVHLSSMSEVPLNSLLNAADAVECIHAVVG